jgi:hypothetical protein
MGRQKIIGLTFLMVCYINVTNTNRSQSLVVRINSMCRALHGQLAFSIWPMNFPDFIDAALTRPTPGSVELIHTHTHTHMYVLKDQLFSHLHLGLRTAM